LKILKDLATEEELQFDDAPDEFLDPLMAELMTDPVELPNSHLIIDRITISKFNLPFYSLFSYRTSSDE